jgi:putative PEP-CTERM system TPR-repeat lipoprotein
VAQCDAGRKERRRRVFACALLALALPLFITSCGLFMDEQGLIERAAKAREHGDLRAALLDLKNVLRKNPGNAEARLALGEVTLATGDATTAIRELEVARERGIPLERVQLALAKAYLAAGRVDDALKLTDAPQGPHAAELLAIRGVALQRLDRLADARASFEQALGQDPKNVDALMGLASTTAQTDGIPAALKIMERALQVDPADPRVRILNGQLQLAAREPALAQKEFEQAVQAAEKRKQGEQRFVALAGQAEAALMQSHVQDVLAITDRMIKLRPEYPLARFMRARALLLAGKPGDARPLLEKNVASNPGATSSKMLLGAIALSEGTFGQAEMYLDSVINAEPDNVAARELLAAARLKQRKSADAIAALVPATGSSEPSSELLAAAGKVSIAAGNTSAGIDYLERSVKADPDNVRARLDLVAGYLAANRPTEAAALLDGVSADRANAAQVRYLKALTLLAKGDQGGAVKFATGVADTETHDASAQMLAGSLLAAAKDPARARSYFERVIALEPRSSAAYLSLARLDLMQGDAEAARKQLTRAMEQTKGDPAAALAMADFEMAQRQPEQAIAVLEGTLQAHPTFTEGRVRLVQILLAAGKAERADALAQEAIRAAPNLAANQRMLGDVRMAQKKYAEAAAAYHKAAATEPSAALAMREFQALRLGGTAADPLAPLRKLVQEQPKDPAALLAFAQGAQESGDRKAAIGAYQQLDALRPNNPAVLNNLAWLKYEEGDPAAIALAKRAHDAAPRDPRIVDTYAWLLVESGKVKEGLALLAPIATGTSDEQFRMHYAQALARAGRRAEARELGTQLASSGSAAISEAARKLVAELDRG